MGLFCRFDWDYNKSNPKEEHMNRRSNKILKDLILGIRQNIIDLENKYNVQERTIRADIREINEDLERKNLPLISEDLEGYFYLKVEGKLDIGAYEQFINGYDFYTYYLSKNERSTILAMILLNANGYITVEQLKDKTGASRNTLLRDLQELKVWFKENNMELISQVRRGYIVDASEIQIRKGILKLLEVNGDDNNYKTGYNLSVFWNLLLQQADEWDIYGKMKNYIIEEEEMMQAFLSDYSFYEAVIELTITVNRIKKNKTISEHYESDWNHSKECSQYVFCSDIFGRIEQECGISIPDSEILYYTESLRGKSYLKSKIHKTNNLDVRIMIAETLYQISSCFGIDFYLDFALYDLLIAHIKSAVHRLKSGEVLVNPLKESLQKDYPEIFDMIRQHIGPLEEYIGSEFSEDEMSFLVLYFASVLEKEKVKSAKNKKVNVALVCETGRGTAQFMIAKMHTLNEMIEVVSISSVHNMKEIENSKAQMLISTIPIDNVKLPCVVVRSPMLGKDDLMDIQKMALEILDRETKERDDKKLDIINPDEVDIQGAFYNLLSEERIQVDYPATDWEDAIRQSGQLLYDTGAVEARYIDEMVNNIKKNGPYIVVCPGTALPHADTEKGVIEEAASLIRLKNPIDFHSGVNDPVRYVIGMSIQSAESINGAIYDLMMIFGNEKIKHILDQMTDAKAVLAAIKKLEK